MAYNEIYKNEQHKRCSRVTKRKLESQARSLKEKTLDGLQLIHYATIAQL